MKTLNVEKKFRVDILKQELKRFKELSDCFLSIGCEKLAFAYKCQFEEVQKELFSY